MERSDYLAVRYQGRGSLRTYFSVSAHHLPFAVRAFQELVDTGFPEEYDVAIRETETAAVLHDVSTEKSELGIVAFRSEQLKLTAKAFYVHDLVFHEVARLFVFQFDRGAKDDLAAAIHAPVTVMETAGEGGAWGIALLADYMLYRSADETLEDYLQERVFKEMKRITD